MPAFLLTPQMLRRLFAPTIAGAVLGGAFALSPLPSPAATTNVQATVVGASAFGNYLAGRHAEQVGQDRSALSYYGQATQQGELATADLYKRIYILGLTEGRIDDALKALRKIEAMDATAPFANLVKAVHALKINNYTHAAELLKGEDKGIVKFLVAPLTAWAQVGRDDHAGALQALDSMKDQSALAALYHLNAALIHEHAGNAQQAEEHFLAVLEKAGLSLRVAEHFGRHFERRGQLDKANEIYAKFDADGEGPALIALAEKRLKSKQRPPLNIATAQDGAAEALFNIASVLQSQSGDDRVLVLAHLALYLRPDLDAAHIVTAAALERAERYADAIEIYKRIPKSSPLSWNARMHMADNLDRIERTDEAIKILSALTKERGAEVVPYIELGDVLRRHERFKEAIKAYTSALKTVNQIEARHWTVYYARGISYEQTQQWPKAEKDFLQALDLQPDQPLVLNYLGYSWIDQGLHLERALKMIEKAVELRPRDGYIVDSLGWGLYRLGDYPGAVKKLERAVMLRPADPVINDHLGDALWQVGRKREARFQWERAKAMGPDKDLIGIIDDKIANGLKRPQAR